MFCEWAGLAERYAGWLVSAGVTRGLIGPREPERIWERHLLNSAVVAEAARRGARVADVGSGAGLPGLPWAIARPDLTMTLIEPMLRRTRFLEEVVADLELGARVTVRRGRAEECVADPPYDVVTSRALAPLGKLLRWCAPLCRPGGTVVALKGRSASDEVSEEAASIGRVSDGAARVASYGGAVLEEPVRAVEIRIDRPEGLAR